MLQVTAGHSVPGGIEDISWLEATVSVDLTRRAVKDAPGYDANALPDRQQESSTYEHYGRPGYWGAGVKHETEMPRT